MVGSERDELSLRISDTGALMTIILSILSLGNVMSGENAGRLSIIMTLSLFIVDAAAAIMVPSLPSRAIVLPLYIKRSTTSS